MHAFRPLANRIVLAIIIALLIGMASCQNKGARGERKCQPSSVYTAFQNPQHVAILEYRDHAMKSII